MGEDEQNQRMCTKCYDHQSKIRVPKPLKEKIEKAAKKTARSRVAEILYRLWNSFNMESKE